MQAAGYDNGNDEKNYESGKPVFTIDDDSREHLQVACLKTWLAGGLRA
jgi:hypothetical protein